MLISRFKCIYWIYLIILFRYSLVMPNWELYYFLIRLSRLSIKLMLHWTLIMLRVNIIITMFIHIIILNIFFLIYLMIITTNTSKLRYLFMIIIIINLDTFFILIWLHNIIFLARWLLSKMSIIIYISPFIYRNYILQLNCRIMKIFFIWILLAPLIFCILIIQI